MRWFTWLMPILGIFVLILGYAIDTPMVFQISTGWIALVVFTAAFFILYGTEQIVDDAR